MTPLELRTRLTLVIHYLELKRTTNTGRLAVNVLPNSEMVVRGLQNEPVNLLDSIQPGYEPLFLFPSDEAEDLTPEFLKTLAKPVQLIVPDGNWRQASKVHHRHPEIAHIRRVKIGVRRSDLKFIRRETRPLGMATLQAISFAMGVLEGISVEEHLLKIYQAKWEQTLKSRGTHPIMLG